MAKELPDYLSYLLRLWRVRGDGKTHRKEKTTWRASLESSLTGKQRGFASLDDLFAFLREQTDAADDANGKENESGVGS
jgi:hypothetical protein